jgi:hypothetical protein
MRTLVYKRTHNGDPDALGQFGINDCMGTVRAREYDAVIGVGGVGDEPRREGIAEKLTWVGIGPHKVGRADRPLVMFDRFLYFGESGPPLAQHAPVLAAHVYGRGSRTLMSFTDQEQQEVDAILALAKKAPPSPALSGRGAAASERCGEPRSRRRGC